jgi:hypothetical protein
VRGGQLSEGGVDLDMVARFEDEEDKRSERVEAKL